jgi:hypothetical protein
VKWHQVGLTLKVWQRALARDHDSRNQEAPIQPTQLYCQHQPSRIHFDHTAIVACRSRFELASSDPATLHSRCVIHGIIGRRSSTHSILPSPPSPSSACTSATEAPTDDTARSAGCASFTSHPTLLLHERARRHVTWLRRLSDPSRATNSSRVADRHRWPADAQVHTTHSCDCARLHCCPSALPSTQTFCLPLSSFAQTQLPPSARAARVFPAHQG